MAAHERNTLHTIPDSSSAGNKIPTISASPSPPKKQRQTLGSLPQSNSRVNLLAEAKWSSENKQKTKQDDNGKLPTLSTQYNSAIDKKGGKNLQKIPEVGLSKQSSFTITNAWQ